MDTLAGPLYGFRPVSNEKAGEMSRKREVPQIIQVLVWPYQESTDQSVVLRRYYALNLPQAAVRATEIEIRLREQGIEAVLVGIRPATVKETNNFFRAMDALEAEKTVARQKPKLDGKASVGVWRGDNEAFLQGLRGVTANGS